MMGWAVEGPAEKLTLVVAVASAHVICRAYTVAGAGVRALGFGIAHHQGDEDGNGSHRWYRPAGQLYFQVARSALSDKVLWR